MSNTVLLVDDEVNITNSFRRTLRNHVKLEVANSGQEALEKFAEKQYSVVVSDMKMPGMSGLELLEKIKSQSPDTVRMMFTGNSDQKTAVDAVNIGDIFRFINKPCSPQDLLAHLKAAQKQYDLVMAEKVLLNKTLKGVISVLTEVIRMVNPEQTQYSNRVISHMQNLARAAGMKPHWSFEPMVELSQLGYILFPDKTSDNPVPSTSGLQLHAPELAADLIKKIPRLESIGRAILYQSKCFNGEGLPMDDIAGKDIPLGARMLKITCDYARLEGQKTSTLEAKEQMQASAEHYDPDLLTAFFKYLDANTTQIKVDLISLTTEMIIEEELFTDRGQLVATKGQRVTEALLNIICHCIENRAISGVVTVSLIEEAGAQATLSPNFEI